MFCPKCGRQLFDDEVCGCQSELQKKQPGSSEKKSNNLVLEIDVNNIKNKVDDVKDKIEDVKQRTGMAGPSFLGNAYEDGKQIIPDCVAENENEIPIKQYEIATLKNRIMGIPYLKAKGRIQVTNQRLIFRAPGKCFAGRTTLQHEFAINEIAGIESRQSYHFSFWDLLFGSYGYYPSFIVAVLLVMFAVNNISDDAGMVMGYLLAILGFIPFFTIYKKWYLKFCCLNVSAGALISAAELAGDGNQSVTFYLAFVPFLISCIILVLYSFRPSLILVIKTKGGTEAIAIRPMKTGLLASIIGIAGNTSESNHTGFSDIMPAKDAEQSIKELGALISDIQKLGDFGIEKWKK